jgi:hypothetical protein
MKKIKYLAIIIILFACQEKRKDTLRYLDVENNISNYKEVTLSQFRFDVEYLPFATTKENMLSEVRLCDFKDSLVFVSDRQNCLLYNINGNLISKIGNMGHGPGEYLLAIAVAISPRNTFLIEGVNYIYEYDINGVFLDKFKIYKEPGGQIFGNSWACLNDSLFIITISNSSGKEKNKLVVFNRNGDAIKKIKNYNFLKRKKDIYSTLENQAIIYKKNDHVFIKEILNDTLFQLTDDYDLKARYVFDLGKFKCPYSEDGKKFNSFDCIYINHIFEMENQLLIGFDYGSNSPVKRTKPVIKYGVESWYYTASILGIYDTGTNKLVQCKPYEKENPLTNTGIVNDYDGGPFFYPQARVNKSTLAMWLDVSALKMHIMSDEFKNSSPKYPEKKKELEQLVKSLNGNDNPVLMIVKLKE